MKNTSRSDDGLPWLQRLEWVEEEREVVVLDGWEEESRTDRMPVVVRENVVVVVWEAAMDVVVWRVV